MTGMVFSGGFCSSAITVFYQFSSDLTISAENGIMKADMKKFILSCMFFFVSPVVIFALIITSGVFPRPAVLGDADSSESNHMLLPFQSYETEMIVPSLKSSSSTLIMIEKYLKHYNSLLYPYSGIIMNSSEKYGVDPKLIVAIAQQESNLGKSSPDGCNNAWGWGIHARGTTCFESWEEAIDKVTMGIAKNYCSKGLCEDPCEMMKKYTPRSNGSWCRGVNQFLVEMETGNF